MVKLEEGKNWAHFRFGYGNTRLRENARDNRYIREFEKSC